MIEAGAGSPQQDPRQGQGPVRRRDRRRGIAVGMGGAALVGAGALGYLALDRAEPELPAAPAAVRLPAQLDLRAPQGREVRPDVPISVGVRNGRLIDAQLTTASGTPVAGRVGPAGSWQPSERLAYAADYRLVAVAEGEDGKRQRVERSFRTLRPKELLDVDVTPTSGDTVGVGMPIIVNFSEDVASRAEVERALSVTAARPVEGSWHWIDDDEVHYRPRKYWPAHTSVQVRLRLRGVEAGKGLWGEEDTALDFRIGPSMVSVVDEDTLRMTVWRDGKLARTIRVTTGRSGYTTRSGIRVISSKRRSMVMRAPGLRPGQPGYYSIPVSYALRISNSGEFVHGAPWSVGAQGRSRVSHGCVGMSTSKARWFFQNSNVGDVVVVKNTSRGLEPGNGWTDWNVPWAKWQAGSALSTSS